MQNGLTTVRKMLTGTITNETETSKWYFLTNNTTKENNDSLSLNSNEVGCQSNPIINVHRVVQVIKSLQDKAAGMSRA